jgi:hypothetical protein
MCVCAQVRASRKSAADVTAEFYDTFGIGARGEAAQRQVSAAEFEDYYAAVSAAVSMQLSINSFDAYVHSFDAGGG